MKTRLAALLVAVVVAACSGETVPQQPEATGKDLSRYDENAQRLLAMPAEKPDQFLQNARALNMVIYGNAVVFELHLTEDSATEEVRHELEQLGIAVRQIMEKYRRATVYVRDKAELEALGSMRQIRHITGTGTRYTR